MKGFVGEPKALPWAADLAGLRAAKNNHYTYDLDKAKSLLAQSGLANVEFDISWSLAGFQAEYAALAQVIQSDLAKIGIKTNLKPTDPAAFTQAGPGKNPTYNGMRLSAGAFAQLVRGRRRCSRSAARWATPRTSPASTTRSTSSW